MEGLRLRAGANAAAVIDRVGLALIDHNWAILKGSLKNDQIITHDLSGDLFS